MHGNYHDHIVTYIPLLSILKNFLTVSLPLWNYFLYIDLMVRLQFEQRQQGANPADLYWLTISGYTGVILRIRSCNRVSMVLSEILGNTKVHTYEVRRVNYRSVHVPDSSMYLPLRSSCSWHWYFFSLCLQSQNCHNFINCMSHKYNIWIWLENFFSQAFSVLL